MQDAKARFSELLEASITKGPQIVTRRGVEMAVLVPVDQWRRLEETTRPTLKELLLSAAPRAEIPVPARRAQRRHSRERWASCRRVWKSLVNRTRTKLPEIEAWIDLVAQTWNVLPVDARVFRFWATLMHRRPDHLIEDALIAATAIVHHLTVVTRNTRDFAIFQVETLNPFATK